MVDTDIVVVGGGPAGVLAASVAAKEGSKVILVDIKSKNSIGDKTCGDAIALKPLLFLEKEFGLALPSDGEVSDDVETLLFKTKNGEMIMGGKGFILDRKAYGQRLLRMAEEFGVEIRDKTRTISALTSDGKITGIRVKREDTGEKYEIHAKITIDCSGRNYIVRKTLPPEDFPNIEHIMEKRDICYSYREIIRINDDLPDHPYSKQPLVFFREDIPEPGYFWFFPKGNHRINVGTGWLLTANAPKSMKTVYREILSEYYTPEQYTVEDAGGYTIPTRYPLGNAVANGFITAGDAAFHVTPLTAEGHAPALIAGYFAGKVAAEAINDGDYSETRLWPYNVQVLGYFGAKHAKSQIFQEALVSLKTKSFDFLLKRNVISKDDYQILKEGKKPGLPNILYKIIKMFPRYKYLPKIYKLVKKSSQVTKLFNDYPDNPEDYPAWNERYIDLMNSLKKF
ncbi:MAG: NAD(P)/FAD-dependent oxidoreductase [Candidatus Hodarchaeales archaeon]